MDYKDKYLKYKLKYLNVKNMIKHGGSQANLEKIKELQSLEDYKQDKKIIEVIEKEKLYEDIPKHSNINPTLPKTTAGLGFSSDIDADLTLLAKPINALKVPVQKEYIIYKNYK